MMRLIFFCYILSIQLKTTSLFQKQNKVRSTNMLVKRSPHKAAYFSEGKYSSIRWDEIHLTLFLYIVSLNVFSVLSTLDNYDEY